MSRTGTLRKPHPIKTQQPRGKYCGYCGGFIPPGQTEHKCYEVKRV